MSVKYKVIMNDKVLGNYPGQTPEIAVNKAIAAHSDYMEFNYPATFEVYRGDREHHTIIRYKEV